MEQHWVNAFHYSFANRCDSPSPRELTANEDTSTKSNSCCR